MAEAGPKAPAIGIDLGTTYSCVAVCCNEKVEVLSNDNNKRVTPSVVAFTPDGRLYGDAAKDYSFICPDECIDNVKRVIGRSMEDPKVREFARNSAFTVVKARGKLHVQVADKTGPLQLRPEEISAMILKQMKSVAERHLGVTVTEAVITVPAYFTDTQRRATLDAGDIAGLRVLQILNEPTAAALAYGFDNMEDDETRKLLVYDLGGGTFDVSVLTVDGGEFVVESTGGNNYLGGTDIDTLMVKTMSREFQRTTGLDLNGDKRALRRLRAACEKAKIELSTSLNATVDISSLMNDLDFTYPITRAWLEDLCENILLQTRDVVENILDHGKVDKASVTDVVLVGGSTRMPMVRDLMKEIFNGKDPHVDINPDEAVAYGAAIQAAILSGAKVKNMRLREVVPLSLGIATQGGVIKQIIKRNTKMPAERSIIVTTSRDNQEWITLEVFEGERRLAKDSTRLGEFTLMGIPPTPKGIPKLPVTFKLDRNGILQASAFDPASERTTSLTLSKRSNLSPESLRRAIQKSAEMEQEDLMQVRRINAKNRLEQYVRQIRDTIENRRLADKIEPERLDGLERKLKDTNDVVRAENTLSYVEYDNYQNDLEEVWKPIGLSLYQQTGDLHRPSSILDSYTERDEDLTESQWTDLGPEVILDI